MSVNKVMLIGNLGGDPEIKYSTNGTAIANFSIATTENRKNSAGEWEDKTEWHKIVIFGKQAEFCKDYLKKGSKIYLEGRLQTRTWEDQNNQRHYVTEVVGSNIMMLDAKSQDSSGDGVDSRKNQAPSGTAQKTPADSFPEADDDLPF